MATWHVHEAIAQESEKELKNSHTGPCTIILTELNRLKKQRCPYCSGFGHAGKDCPTDNKISRLRGGIREQNAVLVRLRKKCRISYNLAEVTGFSLLSAKKTKTFKKSTVG